MEELVRKWLERHFMRNVSERYAILFLIDFPEGLISRVQLDKTPRLATDDVMRIMVAHGIKHEAILDYLRHLSLPAGIPAPELITWEKL